MRPTGEEKTGHSNEFEYISSTGCRFYLAHFLESCLGGALGGLGVCHLLGGIGSLDDAIFCGGLGLLGGVFGGVVVGFIGKIYAFGKGLTWILATSLAAAAFGALLTLFALLRVLQGLGGLSG